MKHIYRTYFRALGLPGIAVCQNCAKFKTAIEKEPHDVYEHGYCDPECARCAAEDCKPKALTLIKPALR